MIVNVVTGLAAGWILCGLLWWTIESLAGTRPRLLDFYFVWRWRRP